MTNILNLSAAKGYLSWKISPPLCTCFSKSTQIKYCALNTLSQHKKQIKRRTETKCITEPSRKGDVKIAEQRKLPGWWVPCSSSKHMENMNTAFTQIAKCTYKDWQKGERLDLLPLVSSYYHLGKKQSVSVSLIVNAWSPLQSAQACVMARV